MISSLRALTALALLSLHNGSIATTLAQESSGPAELVTVAERSEYAETGKHADVMSFCEQLAKQSPRVALAELGKSFEGRSIPLLIISDPAVKSAAEARKTKKLVVFAMGNIHAGEVCGKEALQMLARDLVAPAEQPLFDDLVILFAPIYNSDGNDRFDPNNRRRQNGPRETGERANAQGLDLNRDHVKLESPEARALAVLMNDWQPAIAIDCHTTNGSYHRFALTYDGPRHPATAPSIVAFARDEFLPEVSRRMGRATDYKTFFYGNFFDDHKVWETYPADPCYSTHYFGLRNQIGILSEAHAYASFRDRVLATRDFVRTCLELAADRKSRIEDMLAEVTKAANEWRDDEDLKLGIRYSPAPVAGRFQIPGYVEELRDGKVVATDETTDYEVVYRGATRPTMSVRRPYAYIIPPDFQAAIETLKRHGVELELLREDIELDVEEYQIQSIDRSDREFQGHRAVQVDVSSTTAARTCPAGSIVVRSAQPKTALITTLLEPASQDGLTTWNFFDKSLEDGATFPVVRLVKSEPLHTVAYDPLREIPSKKKPITFDAMYGQNRPNFSGRPASGFAWLDDGEHYLQRKSGGMYKVHARTGRNTLVSENSAVAKALKEHFGIEDKESEQLAGRLRTNKQETAGWIQRNDDLYYVTADGKTVRRLTSSPEPEELVTFSPDGEHLAFVRANNLFSVPVKSGEERQLTADASEHVSYGKADWVYFEEIYGRDWQAYKWSPDSRHLLLQKFDDTGVDTFTVLNQLATQQRVEITHYPKAGRPNPRVELGIVQRGGGPIRWIALDAYSPDNMLISHFGWYPDSKSVYYYAQDRTQQWLDFNRAPVSNGPSTKLFRETTEAWVDNPGDPHFLKDGSFLLFSERDGWKHLYHYTSDGKLVRQVTKGPWEVRKLHVVDEDQKVIYFSGTCDSHLAQNIYRIKLDGTEQTRLTRESGDNRVTVSPNGKMYLVSNSDRRRPTTVALFGTNGELFRAIDTNPVPVIDDYDFQRLEFVQIETRDGFVLEGSLIKPPGFDAQKKYPVWLLTYGGPHAPTMSDSWRGGRSYEQMLAQMGIVVFRVDPRSASGKGACSAWTTYRKLGIQELADLEDAVKWLNEKPFVDGKRIGMAGHSFGGFLTAYAMTHSKMFAAGIAGAPVTDWRNYDTIYTERYMSTPQDNPDGYKDTSVVEAGKNLHGRLLILHGARDDNVHFANTLQLVQVLQGANKKFEMMVYPNNRHGIFGRHYSELTVGFIRRALLSEK